MGNVKPILFNTAMVQAILDGKKTVTRRCVRYKYSNTEMKMRTDKYGTRLIEIQKNVEGETYGKNPDGGSWQKLLAYREPQAPYKRGDILYVRETWNFIPCIDCPEYIKAAEECAPVVYEDKDIVAEGCYVYKASVNEPERICWRPSIHMPKDGARIWLRVTSVRAERLQDIIKDQPGSNNQITREGCAYGCDFIAVWENSIPRDKRDVYGWEKNPWVWVIEFERCVKPMETDNE